jgi:hypothetical protein
MSYSNDENVILDYTGKYTVRITDTHQCNASLHLLCDMTEVQSLVLSHIRFGKEEVSSLIHLLLCTKGINKLEFSDCSFFDSVDISRIFSELNRCNVITNLTIDDCFWETSVLVYVEIYFVLRDLRNIHTLCLRNIPTDNANIWESIWNGLTQNKSVRTLELSQKQKQSDQNDEDKEAMRTARATEPFEYFLNDNKKVENLTLSIGMDDKTVFMLFHELQYNHTLQYIELRNASVFERALTPTTFKSIERFMAANRGVRQVVIDTYTPGKINPRIKNLLSAEAFQKRQNLN